VEAVFEGEVEKIKQMIQLCKQGSPGAIVSAVKVLWESFTGGFRDFRILY
jgi:acylphosphatase